MIYGRQLARDEVRRIWTIDRSEVIEMTYTLAEGVLLPRPEHFDVRGWPPGEIGLYTSLLEDCFEAAGSLGCSTATVVGVAVLRAVLSASRLTSCVSAFDVSNGYRTGLGRQLLAGAKPPARRHLHLPPLHSTPLISTWAASSPQSQTRLWR